MVNAQAELVLVEGRRDHRNDVARLCYLAPGPATIEALRSGWNKVGAVWKLGFQQRARNRVDRRYIHRPRIGRPDSAGKGVDRIIRAVVSQGSRYSPGVGGLVYK